MLGDIVAAHDIRGMGRRMSAENRAAAIAWWRSRLEPLLHRPSLSEGDLTAVLVVEQDVGRLAKHRHFNRALGEIRAVKALPTGRRLDELDRSAAGG